MNISRRRFLVGAAVVGAAVVAAPAIVRSSSIMPVRAHPPILWGDGIHDDTAAIQYLIDEAARKGGGVVDLSGRRMRVSDAIVVHGDGIHLFGGLVKADDQVDPVIYVSHGTYGSLNHFTLVGGTRGLVL